LPIEVGKGLQVGVLALQGSVMEHVQCLQKIPGIDIIQVRKPQQLSGIDGIILPGGESTTMGKLLRELGILEHLRELSCSWWKRISNSELTRPLCKE
jgi:5'-phosphate synthase pdxT subunit